MYTLQIRSGSSRTILVVSELFEVEKGKTTLTFSAAGLSHFAVLMTMVMVYRQP